MNFSGYFPVYHNENFEKYKNMIKLPYKLVIWGSFLTIFLMGNPCNPPPPTISLRGIQYRADTKNNIGGRSPIIKSAQGPKWSRYTTAGNLFYVTFFEDLSFFILFVL